MRGSRIAAKPPASSPARSANSARTMTPEAEAIFDDANGDLALGDLDVAVEKYRRCTELAPDFADARIAPAP